MKNIYLINQFDKIKIPFWVYWMPILGPKLYWDFFRSLFREFDERNFIWRFKRKYMFLSFGIFIINAFLVLFINIILFVILLSLDVSLIYCLYFFIASFGLTFIFEFIYQPLITMKSKSIIKKSYNHYYWSKYDREVDYNEDTSKIEKFNGNEIFANFKNNFFTLKNDELISNKEFDIPVELQCSQEQRHAYLKAKNSDPFGSYSLFKKRNCFVFSFVYWYVGMMYLLNEIDSVLNRSKLYLLGLIHFVVNLLYIVFHVTFLALMFTNVIPITNIGSSPFSVAYVFRFLMIPIPMIVYTLITLCFSFLYKKMFLKNF